MTRSRRTQDRPPVNPTPAIAADLDWSAVHALVVGMGESGLAASKWLARHGARVTVLDTRTEPPQASDFEALASQHAPRIELHRGVAAPLDAKWLDGVQMLIPSPGLSPHVAHQSPIAALLQQAESSGTPVYGEIDLFEWAIHHAAHASGTTDSDPDLSLPLELPRVIAITGTNGKTTTTQMTVALLRRAGLDAQEAGNISPSLLDAVMAREDQSRFPQVWVLELSSFQLAYARHFHPTAGAILNITEDHLDWHIDMDDYVSAKMRIFGVGIDLQTAGVQCVVNRDDPHLAAAAAWPDAVTFGQSTPRHEGDFGLVEEGISWMCVRDLHDVERLHRLMPADALRVRGRHNAMNALAALALCRAATPALAPLLHALREFQGGAHRVQWVMQLNDIDFIDDSKGTNVGATAAALRGLGQRVVLIAGGEGKGQDFAPLQAAIAAHVTAVVTMGKDGPALEQVARRAGIRSVAAGLMPEAVRQAFQLAQETQADAVLLSPACASFDMFKNYVDRAHAFVDAVRAIADEQGVMCS